MKKTHTLYRLRLLLFSDWINNKKAIGLGICILFLSTFSLLSIGTHSFWMLAAYIIGVVASFLFLCDHIAKKVYRNAHLFLTIPASSLEKYCVFIIEYLAIFIVFHFIFWSSITVRNLLLNKPLMVSVSDFILQMYSYKAYIIDAFVITSFIFFSHICFKKHPLLKSLTIIFIIQSIIFWSGMLFITINDINTTNFSENETITFLKSIHGPIGVFIVCGLLCIGYFKLKKIDLR